MYSKEREATLQASLWGESNERFDNVENFDGGLLDSGSGSNEEASARRRTIKKLKKIIAACYPWIHAGNEGPYHFFFYSQNRFLLMIFYSLFL